MPPRSPSVFTIPIHQAFADALVAGLLRQHRADRLGLARGLVLLPNNRAIRSVRDAFVRRAEGGLLLPRLVSIGDPALDEAIGAAFDPLDADPVPPAIDPLARQLILARLIEQSGSAGDAAEAMRLAADLGRTLDQLTVEEVSPVALRNAVPGELAEHWQASLAAFELVLRRWPEELARRGRIDLAERRNRLLDQAARRWERDGAESFVVAAGISVAGPAIGRLLRAVARMKGGAVVLAGLDRLLPDDEWHALELTESHPQFTLRQLLDRIGVARGEVRRWQGSGGPAAPAIRSLAASHAMTPAAFTDRWLDLSRRARRMTGVKALELATPAEEAQAIAAALRGALEVPGRTAALVTPDRALAGRVAAHLRRWGIVADDSAGRPLDRTAPGTLLLGLAEVRAEAFAPVPLLALLKHPLVRSGDGRGMWLEQVRTLDRALRGPRPAPGLDGISDHLRSGEGWQARDRRAAQDWWEQEARPLLEPLAAAAGPTIIDLTALLRTTAQALAGDAAWTHPAGRAAAELIAALEESAGDGPAQVTPQAFVAILRGLMAAQAVRPPQGGHPRIAILGLIEARLQRADLVVLAGLNEGMWPALPAPDPWLAPAIRRTLGLPGIERRIGVEAQEFAAALGAPEVLITRARRDARAPAVASRFWLRLEAMTGGLPRHPELRRWAAAIDRPARFLPAGRPAPSPPVADRPTRIAVTKLDRLLADPFAFYADAMLGLRQQEMVDADPGPAWRGTAVHRVLEQWVKADGGDPTRLRPRAEAMLADVAAHPVLRALWTPRLLEAIDWIAGALAEDRAAGRTPLVAEAKGHHLVNGIRLEGTADRIDRRADGSLAIVDYKTGQPPSARQISEGFAMQLGLLGLIAEKGGFAGVEGKPTTFEYWSLAASKDRTLGFREQAARLDKQGRGIAPEEFTEVATRNLLGAIARWLTGDEPFQAKLHPDHAPYATYDQLMRLDEWYGRQGVGR